MKVISSPADIPVHDRRIGGLIEVDSIDIIKSYGTELAGTSPVGRGETGCDAGGLVNYIEARSGGAVHGLGSEAAAGICSHPLHAGGPRTGPDRGLDAGGGVEQSEEVVPGRPSAGVSDKVKVFALAEAHGRQ